MNNQTSPVGEDAERAEFVAWMKSRPGYPFAGAYANLMWDAWQGARRAAPTQPKAQVGNKLFSDDDISQVYRQTFPRGPYLITPDVHKFARAVIDAWAGSRAGDAVVLLRDIDATLTSNDALSAGVVGINLVRRIRNAIESAPAPGNTAQPSAQVRTDKRISEALNTTLWLYRRLPACYGNPPFVDASIMAFADVLGIDAPEAIKERLTLHRAAQSSAKGVKEGAKGGDHV